MSKQKMFRVEGNFITPILKYVKAKSEAEALRKARDSAVRHMKLKAKDFDKMNCDIREF